MGWMIWASIPRKCKRLFYFPDLLAVGPIRFIYSVGGTRDSLDGCTTAEECNSPRISI